MAKGIEEDFSGFLKKMMAAFGSLQMLDGQQLVEEGKITDSNIPINETLLSKTGEEAKDEYDYIQTRKSGSAINPDDEEKIARTERDILKDKSKGFIYGSECK